MNKSSKSSDFCNFHKRIQSHMLPQNVGSFVKFKDVETVYMLATIYQK